MKQIVELASNYIEPILVKYRSKQISKTQTLKQVPNIVRKKVYSDALGNNYILYIHEFLLKGRHGD